MTLGPRHHPEYRWAGFRMKESLDYALARVGEALDMRVTKPADEQQSNALPLQ